MGVCIVFKKGRKTKCWELRETTVFENLEVAREEGEKDIFLTHSESVWWIWEEFGLN